MNRKGSAALWIIGIIIVLAFLAFAWWAGWLAMVGIGSSPFSIGAPCMDWTAIPGASSCATTTDCAAQFPNTDAGISLRCEAGTCQAQMSTCTVEVNT